MSRELIGAVASHTGSRLRCAFVPAAPAGTPPVAGLLAGVAQVDITPPPGLPKAGYSRNAHTGTGFRTRLRATVLHLRHGTTSLAIIASDLLGGSALVQQLVAARIAAQTDVPLAGLFFSATHTHGAPGQFHGTGFYNRFSSNRPGLDPVWVSVLAQRISDAVLEAVQNRRPAALAWGRTQVHGLTRNRSLPAHRQNPGRAGETASSAINPDLNVLRVDTLAPDGGTTPLAALALFSVHGTGVPMSSPTYNADLWAYLYAELAQQVARTHGPVVAAALQGTHGDITPALEGPAGHPEASRIGRGIGAAAAELYGSLDGAIAQPGARTPELAYGLREVDLAASPVVRGLQLPRRPAVGAALLAGARENETPFVARIPPFRAGSGKGERWSRSDQAQKWVVGSRWLQPLVLPLDAFPRVLPVHLARVGEVLLTGLPMEITTETGRRVASAAAVELPGVRPVVCSVVDEYAGYCTTEQEYTQQFYEGGHTLYGPGTQRFLAAVVAELAAGMGRANVDQALPERRFDLPVRRYWPAGRDPEPVPWAAAPPVRRHRNGEDCLEWMATGPAPGAVHWHQPLAAVELPGGRTVTDAHGDIEIESVVQRGQRGRWGSGGGRYAVRWYPGTQTAGGRHPGVTATDVRLLLGRR